MGVLRRNRWYHSRYFRRSAFDSRGAFLCNFLRRKSYGSKKESSFCENELEMQGEAISQTEMESKVEGANPIAESTIPQTEAESKPGEPENALSRVKADLKPKTDVEAPKKPGRRRKTSAVSSQSDTEANSEEKTVARDGIQAPKKKAARVSSRLATGMWARLAW